MLTLVFPATVFLIIRDLKGRPSCLLTLEEAEVREVKPLVQSHRAWRQSSQKLNLSLSNQVPTFPQLLCCIVGYMYSITNNSSHLDGAHYTQVLP